MNNNGEIKLNSIVNYLSSFVIVILAICLFIYYLINPSFFINIYAETSVNSNYLDEYKDLKNKIVQMYSAEFDKRKSVAQDEINRYLEKYKLTDEIACIVNITYSGEKSINEIMLNEMIATYDTLLKFTQIESTENKKEEFICEAEKYFEDIICNPDIEYIINEIKKEDIIEKYIIEVNVDISRKNREFLKSQIDKAIRDYKDKEKISYKSAEQLFYQFKQLGFDCLCSQSGVKMNYTFSRAKAVRNFVSSMDKNDLSLYQCSRKKALNSNAITTYYGVKPDGTMHNGIDIGNVGETTKLISINDGIVVSCFYDKNLGNTWKTDKNNAGNNMVVYYGVYNGDYVFYFYCHLSEVYVKTNEVISENKIIGQTGNTGTSTGPHLHWEVVLMDIYTGQIRTVDPLSYCVQE